MRVAYVSPLPPQRSGIADYSAELVPHLAEHLELELFSDRPSEAGAELAGLPVHAVASLATRDDFDLAVYHLGNHPDFHASILDMSMRRPGVVVLHEFMLHHLVQGTTLVKGDSEAYVEAMRYCYGQTGESLARRHIDIGLPVDVWRYPLFERVVDRSLGLIVHNHFTADRVHASRPGVPIEVVPHHLSLDALPTGGGKAVRERWGIADDELLIASFGFVTPQKRLEVTLRAFAELRGSHPESRFLIAGEISPYYDLDALFAQGLGEGVVVTGRLPLADLLAAMDACDVAVNLRYPTGGETSGTLIRLLGMGKPVIVSNHGSFAEIPDGCCAKLDLDGREISVLAAYLKRFADDVDLRDQMGRNAREWMESGHTLPGSAAAYAGFLERLNEDRPPIFQPAPPLLGSDDRQVYGGLVQDVGSALGDLAIAEDDDEIMADLAAVLVGLDIDREGAS